MAEKKSYIELLRHPKWQALRLRIMEREKFQCEGCGENEKTLNVHHKYYKYGKKPWEYPIDSLQCLCEDCHEEETELSKTIKELIRDVYSEVKAEIIGVLMRNIMLDNENIMFKIIHPTIIMEICNDNSTLYYLVSGYLLDNNYMINGIQLEKLKEMAKQNDRKTV